MNAHDAEVPSRSTAESSPGSSSAGGAEHPLAKFRNTPAVIDDRIHGFVCRSILSGKVSFRPSLLHTQVAESLGGSDPTLVDERVRAHCGEGKLLRAVLRVVCPACGFANSLMVPAAGMRPDATLLCGGCGGNFRLADAEGDETLWVNEDFCQYFQIAIQGALG